MKTLEIKSFGGAFTSVDPREIVASNSASDLLNVRVENKALSPRYGYQTIHSAQSSFSTAYGLEYVSGYVASTLAATEEYVSFEKLAGNCRPFSRNVSTGNVTAITVSGSGTDLDNSPWTGKAFGSSAYFVNPNETKSVKKYTLGTTNSWKDLAAPTSPATKLSYSVQYGGSAGYTTTAFTGVLTGDVTYTGIGVNTYFAVNADGSIKIGTDSSKSQGAMSTTIDVKPHGAGNQDYTNNDVFYFTIQGATALWTLDPTSVQVSFVNDSAATLIPTITTCRLVSAGQGGSGPVWGVRVEFEKSTGGVVGYDRTVFSTVRKYVISLNVVNNAQNFFTVSPITRGGIWYSSSHIAALPKDLLLQYTYYYSTNTFESGFSVASLQIPFAVLQGFVPNSQFLGLGVRIRVTFTASGDGNVDNYRFYSYDTLTDTWRLVVTQTTGTGTTYDFLMNYDEFHLLPAYISITPFKTDKCVNLCPFKSWMVWFYQGGTSSVRHSRVGNAEKQASVAVDGTDPDPQDNPLTDIGNLRGASFSLPGQGDEPLGGVEAGDTLLIPGSFGVYAQVGTAPSLMTPPKRIAGSFGCANKFAFTRWHDDNGNPSMAYVTVDGQIRQALVSPQFTGDVGGYDTPLSTPIYSGGMAVMTFLRDGQSLSDLSTLRMGVDQFTDSLWIVMGKRALALRRPHPETGTARQWEAYDYTNAITFPYIAFSTKRWLKALTSAGKFVEFERSSSTGLNLIGTLRDDGVAIGDVHWQSGTYVTPNSRIDNVMVERDTISNTPTVQVSSTRQTFSKIIPNGLLWTRFPFTQQGRNHVFKITLGENFDPIRRIEVHIKAAGSRLNQ